MDSNGDQQSDGQRREVYRGRLLLVVMLFGVLATVAGGFIYEWAARVRLRQTMLSDSYSLKNDPVTRSRLKAILPQLIAIHRDAVAECGTATMADLSRMNAFNQRIRSWHAILMATDITADATGLAYIEAFVRSDRALPEEISHGKRTLQEVREKLGRKPEENGF